MALHYYSFDDQVAAGASTIALIKEEGGGAVISTDFYMSGIGTFVGLSTFNDGLIVEAGVSTFVGVSSFQGTVQFDGAIEDKDGEVGTAGQILSSTGSAIDWIDASTTSVANASNVGTNLDSTDATQYVVFLQATSSNNPCRVDTDLTYNPSTNVFTAGTVNDAAGNVRSLTNNAKSGSYTLVAGDVGELINTDSDVEIPPAVFSAGDAVTIYNSDTTTAIDITRGTGVTLYLVGTSTNGDRTLAVNGVATIMCVGTNIFVIMGGGIS
tara:strand:- start:1822 stop:2625 length:804 start_codon:yes stop_codon:yes gene_type:complete